MPLPGIGLLRRLGPRLLKLGRELPKLWRRLLKLVNPPKPPLSPKHREDQIKFVASSLQALAFAVLVGVLIGPTLNPGLVAPALLRYGAVVIVGLALLAGFLLLRYTPQPPAP